MEYQGLCHILGDNIDTDLLLSGKYLSITEPQELALHCLESLYPNWSANVHENDILIAGKNFGCGSSREHAATALYATGIRAILAPSFGNIFYRNAINVGILALSVPASFLSSIKAGEKAFIYLKETNCIVQNMSGKEILCPPMASLVQNILKSKGLMNYLSQTFNS